MDAVTKRNLKEWITANLDKFPPNYAWEDFENSTPSVQDAVLAKLFAAMGYKGNWQNYTMKKSDFARISDVKFASTLFTRIEKTTILRIDAMKQAVKTAEPAPKWFEIDTAMQNNFKKWLGGQTKKYDERFSVALFDTLPDNIKVEFYFTLAKRFGVNNYLDLKTWKRTANDLLMGVKDLKISEEIQEAIYDVVPVTKSDLMKTIKSSDRDGTWSAQTNIAMAAGIDQEAIDAARENRKFDKKMAKLKARVNSIQNLEQYKLTLEDPLFDRSMFETILKRMENRTAFKDTWNEPDSKEIIKLIVNHPLATTMDLVRINKMRTTRWGGASTPLYNSSHLNTALAAKDDLPIDELMKLIKLQQYDLKVKAAGRTDMSDVDMNILIEYAIKHHSHMPDQLREIFAAAGKTDLLDTSLIRGSVVAELKKKYSKGNSWQSKPNGLKFLEVMDNYGWFDELTQKDKEDMSQVIATAYTDKRISKDRIVKLIDRLGASASEILALLYEQTGDEDFLPSTAKDIFLF